MVNRADILVIKNKRLSQYTVTTSTNEIHIITILFFLVFTSILLAGPAEPVQFFDTLESKLRDDYRTCTGDSTPRPISQLLLWKKLVDSQIESDSFPVISKAFFEETGLVPSDVRPCNIFVWYQNRKKTIEEAQLMLDSDIKRRQKKIDDSILIAQTLQQATVTPLDFKGIPFGIPKTTFKIMLNRAGIDSFADEGSSIQLNSISLDGMFVKTAFHFDNDGIYRMYELESEGGPLDSLEAKVRTEAAELGSYIQVSSALEPDHIFRIGRFDITQGRLTVERSWDLDEVAAFSGFATCDYHYYAKAVIVARDIKVISENSLIKDEKNEYSTDTVAPPPQQHQ